MKQYKLQDIRNVGVIGHGAAGKTSVAEAILFNSGVSDRLGKVGDATSVMDYDPDEIKRGHSVNASVACYEWKNKKVNLVDTPGNNNFIADTPACLRVVDGAVVVISADEGVQFFTEKTWRWADDQALRKIVFINKVDHERSNIPAILESLKKTFQVSPALLFAPVGVGDTFSGVADIVQKKFYACQSPDEALDWPESASDELEMIRAELIEAIAEADDELLEHYLEKGELSDEEAFEGLKNGIANGTVTPVICGLATQNIGVKILMNAINDYLPSPDQREAASGLKPGGDTETSRMADPSAPASALVFKTIADPYAGKLTLFRVFSGVVKADAAIFNATQGTQERIGQLFIMQGKQQISAPEISTGDIGAVAKLKVTTTGDTLCDANDPIVFPPIDFPSTVFTRALIPKTRGDEEKISVALKRLTEEDPTLQVERNAQTHELLVSGMGQVHLDVSLEKMHRRFGVDVEVKAPKVPYRETIRGTTKVQGKYKKQTGGRGQFGDTWIEISPLPKGGGFEFENRIVGGAIPKQYIPAVEKGIYEAMEEGALAHCPMVDIKIALYDGSFHNVDSSEMAFKIAGSLGFKKGVLECKPILLEPVMKMEIIIPSEYVGDVMGDLNAKRGKILGIDSSGDNQTIRAHIPMAEVLDYAADLRSMTSGRGVFMVEFDHYDDVPEHLSAKVIAEARAQNEKEHS
ncbi:MAG: elongation factor G [Candidatus Nitrohelix vancouverensis]|uniref:Elongation factor G n=1 Tax=Candidatus Nitrohelix vancouverensis TaxID=2705534 RepID=A0A7T0C2V1_9BACT|nr:MAG: elongation factor G [Candidatus Nitrohelix vancouverensis]